MEMVLWGFVLALVLSLILAIVRVFRVPALHWLAMLYISFFRGTPLLVQLFLLYYGLPQLFPIFVGMDAFTAAIIGLTLHFAAYMAESIRAAILGIHKSQMEAALSIGMSRLQAMQRIILPQAARIATPSLMNYFIDMIKSTSLAFTLGWRRSWAGPDGSGLLLQVLRELHGGGADLLGGGHLLHPLAASAGSAAEPCLLKEACHDQPNGSLQGL